MANVTEVVDREIDPVGNINPNVPPLTEEKNVFNPQQTVTSEMSSDRPGEDERKNSAFIGETEVEIEHPHVDPFVPFDDLPDEPKRIVTIRAVVLGCMCGAAVNASNVYLGLKTGWTFSASLFGAIIGFSVLKSLAKALPQSFPILGGDFGPRENNIVQTSATAAGGLSSVFVSGIPALYQLNLLSTPQEDFWRLVSLTVVGGYFGFAFATPLRKFFIIYVARELRLVFPSSSATAMTIRSMHAATTGEAIAKLKMRALSIAFSAAFALRVASQYATGILWDWHLFTWFYIWSGHSNQALAIENWGWLVEWTPAFIGVGILVGLNTAFSFFAGSVLAWGIVGPTLVHHGEAFGVQLLPDDPKWSPLVSFASLSVEASNPNTPSPRFWLLWPGVLLMIAVSFAELALQYKVIFHVFRAVVRGSASGMNALMKATMKKTSPYLQRKSAQIENDMVEDPAADHELVKWWMWSPLLVMSIILCCVGHGRTIRKARRHEFALRLPRLLLLLPSSPMRRVSTIYLKAGLRRANNPFPSVTDITPLTAASKASQIILGGATQASNWPVPHAQQLNLLGGSLASIGANQASDLTGDFRVGFLLRTPPFQQWLTQGLGTVVAVFLSPAMFMLFAKAYPCILDPEIEDCPFGAPSVAAWRAVAVAITDETFPVPRSSGIFSIVFAIFGVLMVIIRQYAYLGRWEKYRVYHPNMMCVGLAFVLPQTHYGTAMVIGAVAAYFWAKRGPGHFDVYGFAVAAGLIAGEGIGGVVNAIFQIAGISGDVYGSNVGCPAQSC